MLAIAGVAIAAVVLFAIPLGIALNRSLRDREQLRLQRDTVAATRAVDLSASPGDPIELPPSRDDLGVYDGNGRRVAGRGPLIADALTRAALRTGRSQARSEHGRLLAAAPIVTDERTTGAVRADRAGTEVTESARRAWLLLGGVAAAVVAAAVLAALALARRLARPLERLALDAHRLGDGRFPQAAHRSAIPEVDAVSTALDATAQRLHDLLSRERAFSANASHQLRTPLAALRLELEAMQMQEPDSPELAGAVAQIERLQTTIETLLAVARDLPRSDQQTDIVALVDDAAERWRGRLASANRPLRTSVEAVQPVTSAAAQVLSEVLDVLLSNADRHGAGTVSITVRDVGGSLAVDVVDEGPGFDEADQAFARRAAGGGHGLGLVLARALAEAEGGRLSITQAGPHPKLTLHVPRSGDQAN